MTTFPSGAFSSGAASSGAFPSGARLRLDPGVRRIDGGLVLVGGSPTRLLRLTAAGARWLDGVERGDVVPPTDVGRALARRLLDAGMAHPVIDEAGPLRSADVTVVVPVRDGRVPQVEDDVAAIVVVDDGSRVPIPGAIRHERARGPAAARNVGWRAASTPLIAFVDADCAVPPRWLDGLLPYFADPAVAAVAPRILSDGAGWLGAYDVSRSPLDRGSQAAPVRLRSRVPFVPSTALVVRRAVLETLDGFDERLRFGEDVDLVWRMLEHGHVVRYEPQTVVRHPARTTLRGWVRQRFDYGTSAAPLAARHPGAMAPLAVSRWSALAWALAAFGHPVAATATAATSTALLAPKLEGIEHPWAEAVRLAGIGNVRAGIQIADAIRRVWWPLAIAAALGSHRARLVVAAAFLPAIGNPVRILDDLAYGAGVWVGCWREGTIAPLVPDLSSWPGRGQAVATAPAAVATRSIHVSGSTTTESILR